MNILNMDSSTNSNIIETKVGPFTIIERKTFKSVSPQSATSMYFYNALGGRFRQIVCDASNGVVLQNGAMQSIIGDVEATTGLKGVGDLLSKSFRGHVSGESAINPEYEGAGYVITEPTLKYLISYQIEEFNGSVVLEDGYFYASESSLKPRTVSRKSLSSAVAGNEGLINMALEGKHGAFVIESEVAPEDLVVVKLENETLKIDGSMAIAWSKGLRFTVERSSKSLIGSMVNGDGLVNVYRGTGMVIYKALSRV